MVFRQTMFTVESRLESDKETVEGAKDQSDARMRLN